MSLDFKQSAIYNAHLPRHHREESEDTLACKKLLYAILERSIMDLVADTRAMRPIYPSLARNSVQGEPQTSLAARSALQWIMDDRREDISSYNRICSLLEIDKGLLRNPRTLAKVITYFSHHLHPSQF